VSQIPCCTFSQTSLVKNIHKIHSILTLLSQKLLVIILRPHASHIHGRVLKNQFLQRTNLSTQTTVRNVVVHAIAEPSLYEVIDIKDKVELCIKQLFLTLLNSLQKATHVKGNCQDLNLMFQICAQRVLVLK
jgi:hypothetical protein